jgi:hypothetical protein
MGKIRTAIEGYDFPQTAEILVDDINRVISRKLAPDTKLILISPESHVHYDGGHHIDSKEYEQLVRDLNPIEIYYIQTERKGFPPCPQIRWKGYRSNK